MYIKGIVYVAKLGLEGNIDVAKIRLKNFIQLPINVYLRILLYA